MFVNREEETKRLKRVLNDDNTRLIIIYGRRRCGKSTLLKRVIGENSIYFSADMRETPLQIMALAERIEKLIPGFAGPVYPDWDSLFRSLNNALKNRVNLCMDEFQYLVRNSPELPSVLQNIHDDGAHSNFSIVICGSSQMMMHGLVLDSNAPLYGRADEIMKIQPMSVAHMKKFLDISATEAVTEYGIWGGIPRYWEIRKVSGSLDEALRHHVVNQYGIFADEPERLFSDEIRTSVQAFTILTLIGSGCHRLSELASRMGKPATHLSGPLAFLTDLKYVKREIPFGVPIRSTKKSLYKISDPFLNFWFTFIASEKSRIDLGLTGQVLKEIKKKMPLFISAVWEELCRQSVPFIFKEIQFNPASRWWGKGKDGIALEIDIVAESSDKKVLLIGEAKWSEKTDPAYEARELKRKADQLPFMENRVLLPVLFLKDKPSQGSYEITIFDPEDVVKSLA
jgi:AAA+ ATPase superfamily predicted ATPase